MFASTHLFGDIMILITLLYVIIEGAFVLDHQGGSRLDTISLVDNWAIGFGFSIYTFEGIGCVLPVLDVTRNQE